MKQYWLYILCVFIFVSCSSNKYSSRVDEINENDISVISYMGDESGIYNAKAGDHLHLSTGISLGELDLTVNWDRITRSSQQYHTSGTIKYKLTDEPLRGFVILGSEVGMKSESDTKIMTIQIDSVFQSSDNGEFNLTFNSDGKTRLFIAQVGFRTLGYCFNKIKQ